MLSELDHAGLMGHSEGKVPATTLVSSQELVEKRPHANTGTCPPRTQHMEPVLAHGCSGDVPSTPMQVDVNLHAPSSLGMGHI